MANYVEQILSTHVKVDCLSKKKQVFYTYLTKETFLIQPMTFFGVDIKKSEKFHGLSLLQQKYSSQPKLWTK